MGFAGVVLLALSIAGTFVLAFGQQRGQQTFASPQDAGQAFLAAMRAPDDQSVLNILGPAGKDVISSGDAVEDLDARVGFVVKYEEMHRFVTEPNGRVTLVVGAENWPFPIPLVKKNGSWYFDTLTGRGEILLRRIGKNETTAMDALRELVEAQTQYSEGHPDKHFAQKLVSDQGRHNGLYWKGADDEADSPINPLIAYAYRTSSREDVMEEIPFNGYFFRVLTRQGPHAPGGAKDYVSNGQMTRGFAFVAYPAEYRSSGVMTFIVDKSGTIHEKDLGPNTIKIAETMSTYDPDSSWRRAD